ncbi:MAG: phosphoenolpyruvate--protein phosphotransferase [Treponema sp.]|jgi:phosphotransferase system enzyme I (PtsI)|nr:phosphoenolpyruvate--protein phosphotransferase [Treponema sp.]
MLLKGNCAAPGIAVGRLFVYEKKSVEPGEGFVRPGEEQVHLDRYLKVRKQAADRLEEFRLAVEKNDPEKAKIFEAHRAIVDDIVINEEIPAKITSEHCAGDWAIYQVYDTVLSMLRQVQDPLLAERVADFEDVRGLLLNLWHGKKDEGLSALNEPVIIAAREILPSDTAAMDRTKVLAILTEKGGVTSHAAIIAKSYGIPAVLGIAGLLETVKQGQTAAIDAGEGTVIIEPDEETAKGYVKKSGAFLRDKAAAETFLKREGRTADGVKIEVGLNIANASDEEMEAVQWADSVGLFRTEFLYMGRSTLPTEDEQFSVYRKVLERFGKRPVILRTLDIGGDKTLSSIEQKREENPFLGNRALRFCFTHPEISKTQIRAALRASAYGNLWIMLPMVGSLDDIRRAKEFIASTAEEMKRQGVKNEDIKTGIMIEIPSIALVADRAAKEVDFASIGSNDLCQYLCAADRMNSAVEPYYQSYHPAMFKLIKETVSAFNGAGKPISLCGELAADPLVSPVLIGLGMRKLSVGASSSAAAVKRSVASFTVKQAEDIAADVLVFSTAAEVKEYLLGVNHRLRT